MGRTEAVSVARHEAKRFGHLGWREALEPALRRVAAEWLGLPATWLRPDASLADDFAMTSVDVTELVVEMERATGVNLSETAIDGARTYGDLVDQVVVERLAERAPALPRVFLRASLVPGHRDRRAVLMRSIWLSPYGVETLIADARRAGSGARLDITVPASAALAVVERIERCFVPLAAYGVTLRMQYARLPRGRAVA